MTKEHLFSDWLRELFPRTAQDTHTFAKAVTWNPIPKFSQEVRQGHSGSRKIRKVCGTCNNGWVSRIDGAAKEVAPPLINGASVTVEVEAQRALATWFAKIAMVADSSRVETASHLQNDRDWIREHSLPPLLWQVWIGSYEGVVWRDLAIFHHGGRLDLTPVTPPQLGLAGYVTSTALGMGRMIALVIGNENPAIDLNIGTAATRLHRIWPAHQPLRWPQAALLSDQEAGGIAYILRSAIADPRVMETA